MIAGPVQTTPALAMRAAITEFEDVAAEIAAPVADAAPAGNDAPSNDATPAVAEDSFPDNVEEWGGSLAQYQDIKAQIERPGKGWRVSIGQINNELTISGEMTFQVGDKVNISNPLKKPGETVESSRKQSPAESMRSALDDIGSITAENSSADLPELHPGKHEVLFDNEWCEVVGHSFDIENHKWVYDLKKPDGNIRFRVDTYMMVNREIGKPESEK